METLADRAKSWSHRASNRSARWKACPYCGTSMNGNGPRAPTRDHVEAKSRGGPREPSNYVHACRLCNAHKGHMTLEEFHAWLIARGDKRAKHVAQFIAKREATVARKNA